MVVDGGLAPDVCLIHQHVSSSFRVGRFEVAGGRVFRVCRVEILTRCQMPRHGQKPPLPLSVNMWPESPQEATVRARPPRQALRVAAAAGARCLGQVLLLVGCCRSRRRKK